jgi:hypothetical protein
MKRIDWEPQDIVMALFFACVLLAFVTEKVCNLIETEHKLKIAAPSQRSEATK